MQEVCLGQPVYQVTDRTHKGLLGGPTLITLHTAHQTLHTTTVHAQRKLWADLVARCGQGSQFGWDGRNSSACTYIIAGKNIGAEDFSRREGELAARDPAEWSPYVHDALVRSRS